ncbi:MAG TPA: PLP-dependent aspartate aminotransferase family protein [Pyrinomonadaceae bacterium]|nr:PLP-dependent aspartate aminotransferase family protein [Pyrinomonadaceae bacterium]
MKNLAITTQLVHAGERRESPVGVPVSTPIYPSATYTYASMAEMDKVFTGESPDYIYSRYGNPTVAALQEALATVENANFACAYASGMAALHAALFACELSANSVVLASRDLYGASFDLLGKIFGTFGVKTQTADFSDVAALREKALEIRPRVLLAETISNPLLKVCDIAACAEIAREVGARLIVDNTFASPYLCQPLDLGADFSVHSATKYLGGHADATGGIVIAKEEFDRPALVGVMKLVGGVLSVWEAHQILRGIKTLALRLERQCRNAKILAEHFSKHSHIEKVFYPGSADEADLVKRVLRPPHAGALVTIILKDDTTDAAFRFVDALKLCIRATSLGDIFTLISHSATSSHRELSPKRRADLGISDGLVRISVGIEDIDDIIADIEQALEKK